jgi:hypothetical protein
MAVVAHHVAPAGQDDQRYQRKRNAEGQHDLAENQGAGGIGPGRRDRQRGEHGDRPGGQLWEPEPDESGMMTSPG